MILTRVGIRHVRNLKDVDISPVPGLNLVYGANASGKTSLLEGIHLLAHARSFRSSHIDSVIGHEADSLLVTGEVYDSASELRHRLGLERSRQHTRLRLDQQDIRQSSSLAQLLPIQLLTPESMRLLEQGPSQRRRFLDWGLFHVEPTFHRAWRDYARALKQRNAALRSGMDPQRIRVWDQAVIENGVRIDRLRHDYVQALTPVVQDLCVSLLGFTPQFVYRSGWRQGLELEVALEQAFDRDRQQGSTTVGPHRAELTCLTNGAAVQERFSRGQLKLLVSAMRLAQAEHLARRQGKNPVFLVDDLAAELDPQRRGAVLDALRCMDCQVFITATDRNLLDISGWEASRMFHVEHGKITEVV